MTIHLRPVDLAPGVGGWFTGRDHERPDPPVGTAGNLGHRRPHRPGDLARARTEVADRIGVPTDAWHLMQQVHGGEVGLIDEAVPAGAEIRGVDALATRTAGRALVVLAADCVPVLVGGPGVVAAAHAGREGLVQGVIPGLLSTLVAQGVRPERLRAAIGPCIGGCCYEVPAALRDAVAADHPAAAATTRWGTPSLDLPAAVAAQLRAGGVGRVDRVETCTYEDQTSFSHRRDPDAGRQAGIVVLREAA